MPVSEAARTAVAVVRHGQRRKRALMVAFGAYVTVATCLLGKPLFDYMLVDAHDHTGRVILYSLAAILVLTFAFLGFLIGSLIFDASSVTAELHGVIRGKSFHPGYSYTTRIPIMSTVGNVQVVVGYSSITHHVPPYCILTIEGQVGGTTAVTDAYGREVEIGTAFVGQGNPAEALSETVS